MNWLKNALEQQFNRLQQYFPQPCHNVAGCGCVDTVGSKLMMFVIIQNDQTRDKQIQPISESEIDDYSQKYHLVSSNVIPVIEKN